jgi:membrane protease YdiL (CAAX protease family)
MNKETRNLILFFMLTFVASYLSEFMIVLKGWNPLTTPGVVFFWIGTSAPAWVAILMVIFTYTKDKRRDYFRRCFSFKQIKLPYWAFIILVFPMIFAVVVLFDKLMGGALPGMTNLNANIAAPLTIIPALFMAFLSGPGEEFGWRGYSLDPLLRRHGVLRASAILGFIWGIWHLPSFFMPQTWQGNIGFKFAGFWTFMLQCIGMTMIMTWVYLMTNRSVLSAIMMHYFNAITYGITRPYSDRIWILSTVAILAFGLVLCILLECKTPASVREIISLQQKK